MSDREISVWGWVIAACALIIAAALLLPLVARSSNCGGNSSALTACRDVVLAFRTAALERGDKPFSIADLNESERENFRSPTGVNWLPGTRLLVTTEPASITGTRPRKIIAVCDTAYDNVPRRWLGKSPMTHAAAYSDESVGLISVADFQHLNLSRFVDVASIPKGLVEHDAAANRSQPGNSETNRAARTGH